MMLKVESLLRSNEWPGIISRAACELMFLFAIFYAGSFSVWGESTFFGGTLVIDHGKETVLLRACMCMVATGLIIEVINAAKLIKTKR